MAKLSLKNIIISLVFLLIINSLFLPAVYEQRRVQASSIEKEDVYTGLGLMFLMIVLSGDGSEKNESVDIDGYKNLNADEIELLAKIIHAEARGESYKGKVAVGAVILNRVYHPSFPNTIKEVIYQSGQFTPVENGMINIDPDEEAVKAAREAAEGEDPSRGSLYFYNPRKSRNPEFFAKRSKVVEIDNHIFMK